jgi:protein-tyrosine-phosphatase
MNKATFDGYLKASAASDHPLKTRLDFVFTDFQPNKNKQAVPREQADRIIQYGIGMPVKANFVGSKIRSHGGALPIGPIEELRLEDDRIVGSAFIWNDEFSDLTKFLKEKSEASADGVQFSWELYHTDSPTDDSGVTWLNDVIVAGIAIVADPAYAGRTPLLAIAEADVADRITELEQKRSIEMAEDQKVDETEVQQPDPDTVTLSKSEFDAFKALEAEVSELRTFRQEAEASAKRAALSAERRAALAEVLSDEDFEKQTDFILGLDEAQFTSYKDTLTSAVQRHKSSASEQKDEKSGAVPDPVSGNQNGQGVKIDELANALRNYRAEVKR